MFSGWNVTLKSDTQNTSTDFSLNTSSINASGTDSSASIQIENTLAFDTLHVGLGASVQLSKLNQGVIGNANVTSDNMLSVYFSPGVIVGNSTYIYAKGACIASWERLSNSSGGGTYNLKGFAGGVGVKVPLWNNSFGTIEVMQSKYNTYKIESTGTEVKAQSTAVSIGLGSYF